MSANIYKPFVNEYTSYTPYANDAYTPLRGRARPLSAEAGAQSLGGTRVDHDFIKNAHTRAQHARKSLLLETHGKFTSLQEAITQEFGTETEIGASKANHLLLLELCKAKKCQFFVLDVEDVYTFVCRIKDDAIIPLFTYYLVRCFDDTRKEHVYAFDRSLAPFSLMTQKQLDTIKLNDFTPSCITNLLSKGLSLEGNVDNSSRNVFEEQTVWFTAENVQQIFDFAQKHPETLDVDRSLKCEYYRQIYTKCLSLQMSMIDRFEWKGDFVSYILKAESNDLKRPGLDKVVEQLGRIWHMTHIPVAYSDFADFYISSQTSTPTPTPTTQLAPSPPARPVRLHRRTVYVSGGASMLLVFLCGFAIVAACLTFLLLFLVD